MRWTIDPNHSSVNFSIRHMTAKVRGTIAVKEGWIEAEEGSHTAAAVEVVLDAASINTGVAPRDNDLRSPNFLEVEKYPTISFKSTRVDGSDPKNFKLIGDLSIHGVTRPVSLETEYGGEGKDPYGNRRVGFSARTRINRKDFGLTWNAPLETGGFLVGDELGIEIEVEAMPAKVPAGSPA